jgi:hypothetical protein
MHVVREPVRYRGECPFLPPPQKKSAHRLQTSVRTTESDGHVEGPPLSHPHPPFTKKKKMTLVKKKDKTKERAPPPDVQRRTTATTEQLNKNSPWKIPRTAPIDSPIPAIAAPSRRRTYARPLSRTARSRARAASCPPPYIAPPMPCRPCPCLRRTWDGYSGRRPRRVREEGRGGRKRRPDRRPGWRMEAATYIHGGGGMVGQGT